MWIFLVLFYGLAKGLREIVKKKSIEKNTVIEVLVFYTFISFIMVLPDAPNAGGITARQGFWIAIKSFVIFLAWICSFRAIKYLPISFYGILDLSRVLFATLLGVFVLKETMGPLQLVGLVLVLLGLLLLKVRKKGKEQEEKIATKYVILAFVSCIMNAVSGLMDKILMQEVTSSQLQFWYMLFLIIYYLLYVLFTRAKLCLKSLFKNYWIYILSLLFVLADRALFIANADPASKVTIMTLIKQSGCVVTILAGKFIFKEKNIGYKLLCAGIIVSGIVIAVL